MSEEIKKLEPKEVWKHFYSLTRVPRPSKHEEAIQKFIMDFGEEVGLETVRDKVGNIIIRKPATPGMENRKGIILQAHLDMVPQKNTSMQHDFTKDPIIPFIDGEWVKAKGTTLGSDNGIGVAAIMAVLESKEIPHGPIEALLTCDEETGMTGANGLQPGLLKGEILINLDSEDEGELYIGCAGGVDVSAEFPVREVEVPEFYIPYRISLTGLKGGHSGLDINYGRGNANRIMNELLMLAADKTDARLAHIEGGNLRNAIPREAFATVVIPENKKEEFKMVVAEFEENAKLMFKEADPGLMITAASTKMPQHVIDTDSQTRIYQAIEVLPNGMISMLKDMPTVVETSTNLAIVRLKDGKIFTASLLRSSVDEKKMELAGKMKTILEEAGAAVTISGEYPGWKPNVDSPILDVMKTVYQQRFGKVPEVKVIHAGLECGILGSKYPHWDMISFGPTIRGPHSPDEKVHIGTVDLFWKFLLETLRSV
ncbi:MAG: aminoacyl-histidine dipeptidase [Desulfosarcina sp.]